jgi:hypothetical protein
VIIDPLLFRRFGVERVPTVVYAAGVSAVGGMVTTLRGLRE